MAPDRWSYEEGSREVILAQPERYHDYTVSFLAFIIWDPVHMYNFITNSWENVEHQITFDVRQPKTQQHVIDKLKKWMVENSWGSASGYRGHLIMTDKWFDEYMFRVVAEKKYVPAKVLDILKQKPIRLPAWDPMFADEE